MEFDGWCWFGRGDGRVGNGLNEEGGGWEVGGGRSEVTNGRFRWEWVRVGSGGGFARPFLDFFFSFFLSWTLLPFVIVVCIFLLFNLL